MSSPPEQSPTNAREGPGGRPCPTGPAELRGAEQEAVRVGLVLAERHGRAERLVRALESLPLGPLWVGVALTVSMGAVYLGWCTALGAGEQLFDPSEPLHLAPQTRIHLIIAVLTAFLLAVRRYDVRRLREELAEIQPLTCCSVAELHRIVRERTASDRRWLRAATGAGVVLGLAIGPATSGQAAGYLQVGTWDAQQVWSLAANAFLFAVMGRGVYTSLAARRLLELVTREIVRIDLLDRSSLAPFARQGLRHALYWAGGSSIASLLVVELPRAWPVIGILVGTLLLATFALVEPARAIRGRLREAKRAELERIRSQIERARNAALDPEGSRGGPGASDLPGLLAYEARIEDVSEWPFDTPTLLRFGMLMIIALGSWVGGAIVERALSAVLG